jgi:hypothetical protein
VGLSSGRRFTRRTRLGQRERVLPGALGGVLRELRPPVLLGLVGRPAEPPLGVGVQFGELGAHLEYVGRTLELLRQALTQFV